MKKTSKPLQVILVIGVLLLVVFLIEMGYRVSTSYALETFREGFAEEVESIVQKEILENVIFDENQVVIDVDIPEEFEEEIFLLDGYQEIWSRKNQGILSFWTSDSVDHIREKLKTALDEKGWQAVDEESSNVTSYIKKDGVFTWLLLHCSKVGGGTTIVVYYR